MARIDELKALLESLGKRGWAPVFQSHGLDIAARDIEAELSKRLGIDRSRSGFEDFCASGVRGVEPGDPAMSVLYHALASPNVHPSADGTPADLRAYPTIAELDLVENYIFSVKPLKILEEDAIIGVFAFEYRPAASTPHGYHADLVFSRTAIARVGTAPESWFGPWRSFRPDPEGQAGISVCPSRFGAFVARPVNPQASDPIMGRRDEQNDSLRTFLYPTQKLFSGSDCIEGMKLDLSFLEFHRNDKLRRIHRVGNIPVIPGFDIDRSPFVRDSTNGGNLVMLKSEGASALVVPRHGQTLTRSVEQENSVSGKTEPVRFVVPAKTDSNRYATSLEIPSASSGARLAPEYVNIRHRVRSNRGRFTIEDMQGLPADQFKQVNIGGYEAAHFADDTADGAVSVSVRGLTSAKPSLAAYSLVAAPDFFPLSDQIEIASWVRRSFRNVQEHFRQGAPWPLCEGRRPVNIELQRPEAPGEHAFDRNDESMTAIICTRPRSTKLQAPERRRRFSSFLSDAAANEFAPGWDVSLTRDAQGFYLAAYGLGSPFPEDAKLCAALNSFWPAVAPDASRTFQINWAPTAMPLLDDELGVHPNDPRLQDGALKSSRGWDGEFGPFEESVNGIAVVNAASLDRSDYVTNALLGRIDIRRTSSVDATEQILRMEALRESIRALPPVGDIVARTPLWLVSASAVSEWRTEPKRASPKLVGRGYVYVFCLVDQTAKRVPGDFTRERYAIKTRFECQISTENVVFRKDDGRWKVVDRLAVA